MPPKIPAAALAAEQSPVLDRVDYDEITYHPGEGDPVRTEWNGLKFAAHIPTRVSKKHTVLVPLPVTVNMPDGTVQTRHVESRVPMVELAKKNPTFVVNGQQAEKPAPGKTRVPESPDEYRGYALKWIAASTEKSAMDVRWDAEAALRDRCGVNDGDIAYLRPFFEAKYEMMAS
jgi:hypothetical protein